MLEGITPSDRYNGPCFLIKSANEKLDASDKKILEEALADKRFSNLRLSGQLTERGFAVSENVVRRHRIGSCACARNPK
jgi:hypothetical protein